MVQNRSNTNKTNEPYTNTDTDTDTPMKTNQSDTDTDTDANTDHLQHHTDSLSDNCNSKSWQVAQD